MLWDLVHPEDIGVKLTESHISAARQDELPEELFSRIRKNMELVSYEVERTIKYMDASSDLVGSLRNSGVGDNFDQVLETAIQMEGLKAVIDSSDSIMRATSKKALEGVMSPTAIDKILGLLIGPMKGGAATIFMGIGHVIKTAMDMMFRKTGMRADGSADLGFDQG